MSKKIITFIDPIGRTIIGEEVSLTKEKLKVKNPAIIHVAQNNQTGQLQVQTLPLFFREFINPSKHNDGTVWEYNVGRVVIGSVELDPRLTIQYDKIFAPIDPNAAPTVAPSNAQNAGSKKGGAEVIKLFDE